jgi:hypothetical protein
MRSFHHPNVLMLAILCVAIIVEIVASFSGVLVFAPSEAVESG